MKIKGKKYEYYVEPYHGKVIAEVYEVVDYDSHHLKPLNISLAKKIFGSWFRDANKQDFIDAREWADDMLQNIYHANK